jgi:hypothetical protein
MFERSLWITMEFMDAGSLTNLLQVDVCLCLSVWWVCGCVGVWVWVCVYVYICIYICMCVYLCLWVCMEFMDADA